MNESFAQIFEESLNNKKIKLGSIIRGKIISIDKDIVLVDAGLKSESSIPAEQFKNSQGNFEINIGDEVDVSLEAIEDGFGETILSREKAKRNESWLFLTEAHEKSNIVKGIINGKVKGGFTVEVNGIRAFLPGSLIDVRPVRDTLHLEGKELDFNVIKIDKKRNNVVVSRRSVIESENNIERDQLLSNLFDGALVKGIVKNLTDYGAFVDLGGIDGLLHITDMAWKRVKHPSEIVNIGDEINVKILKFDKKRTRVSLGLKQLSEDPWIAIAKRYPEGTKLKGNVTNLTDYGCFVEIEEGIEGLVHVSEMDWTNKNIHPSKVANIGDILKVIVLDIDEERRRISLGLKQCKSNPWLIFSDNHNKGDRVDGKIKSITDFGMFIGLEGGIDGLIHLSDISWNNNAEEIIKNYKKGDIISAILLQVDAERERISLGLKQLTEDPFLKYISINKKDSIVKGKILSLDDRSAIILLEHGIEGNLRFSYDALKLDKKFFVDDIIEVKLTNIDRKTRQIILSLNIKEESLKEDIKNIHIHDNKKKQEKKFIAPDSTMAAAFKAATNNKVE